VSTNEFVSSLIGSLAWPVAVVAAVFVLRRPLTAVFGRVRRVEALGISAELDAVEHAREGMESALASPERDISELMERAANYGWHLGRAAPHVPPGLEVDSSSETPAIRSTAEAALRRWAARAGPGPDDYAWEDVVEQLEERISSGELQSGQAFPSVTQISKEYHVDVGVACRALQILGERGRILTGKGQRTIVTPQMPRFRMLGPPPSSQ
jgi:hypothetical protein